MLQFLAEHVSICQARESVIVGESMILFVDFLFLFFGLFLHGDVAANANQAKRLAINAKVGRP